MVIIVDILRACATISALLANGAQEVIPVAPGLKSYLQLKKSYPDAIFVGERNRSLIPYADFNNSPWTLIEHKNVYKDKTVFFKSTDFSQSIDFFVKKSKATVILGCIANSSSVSDASFNICRHLKKDIYLLPCGDPEDRKGVVDLAGCSVITKSKKLGCILSQDLKAALTQFQNESVFKFIAQSKQAQELVEVRLLKRC